MGYGIIPAMALANYEKRGIHVLKVEGSEMQREINIISRADKLFDETERALIQGLVLSK